MDGPTAVRLIRAREIALGAPRTPIFALTANALSHQAAEYRAAGMDGVVAKPIEVNKLLEVLELAAQLVSTDAVRTAVEGSAAPVAATTSLSSCDRGRAPGVAIRK
jgi:CheY-like chemotaxis protein